MRETTKKFSRFALVWAIVCCYCPLPVDAQNVGWVLKAEYDEITEFVEGVAAIRKDGKWGYVSDKGTIILAPAYDIAYPFSEGMGVLASGDQTLTAIVDRTGKLIPVHGNFRIDKRFTAFSDGLLLVSKNNQWGYLNKSGLLDIECKFDLAQPFSEGLAAAVLNIKQCYCWYYMDTAGKPYFHINTKLNVYWALGFHDGKALILHSKGAVFVDRYGKEEKANLPQITPPSDGAAYHLDHTLACKEGILAFDTKCRAISFTANNSSETKFMSITPPLKDPVPDHEVFFAEGMKPKEVLWLNASTAVIKKSDAKIGILSTAIDNPLLTFSIPSDTLFSVFGNDAMLDFNIRNASSGKPDKVNAYINGKQLPGSSPITLPEPGNTTLCKLLVEKTTDNELETRNILMDFYEEGLLIGKYENTISVKDIPSLQIIVPNKIKIEERNETYSVAVEVKNTSDMTAENLTVSIDSQTKEIKHLDGKKTKIVWFSFQSPQEAISKKNLKITVKVPGAPPVKAIENITIEVPSGQKNIPSTQKEEDLIIHF